MLFCTLNKETKLRPTELMTDTASYSDVVFGLFHMLGFQFSPRLADMGDRRFWRIDMSADYGTLNGIASHRIDTDLIARISCRWSVRVGATASLSR